MRCIMHKLCQTARFLTKKHHKPTSARHFNHNWYSNILITDTVKNDSEVYGASLLNPPKSLHFLELKNKYYRIRMNLLWGWYKLFYKSKILFFKKRWFCERNMECLSRTLVSDEATAETRNTPTQ